MSSSNDSEISSNESEVKGSKKPRSKYNLEGKQIGHKFRLTGRHAFISESTDDTEDQAMHKIA